MHKQVIVAFDCDGTLVNNDTPPSSRGHVVALFEALEAVGCKMVIWSAGGVEYAKMIRDYIGLQADIWDIDDLDNQPDICVDDYPFQRGKVTIRI